METFWWVRQIILALLACFFLVFGIHVLIASYGLDNPFWFVMTFFSSNLIILISGALLAGFVSRMVAKWKAREKETEH
ncbi:MAG: hypothetical protein JRH06_09120 [Deltaproteobacteria bacterium]|nr:hypothetical protein [Deltaproteobacteria bacterium]MBW2137705.1 hypothetical protein [Deltaproteobacteria bacterium]